MYSVQMLCLRTAGKLSIEFLVEIKLFVAVLTKEIQMVLGALDQKGNKEQQLLSFQDF